MIEQNPQMLQNVLQELGQANPQLLQVRYLLRAIALFAIPIYLYLE